MSARRPRSTKPSVRPARPAAQAAAGQATPAEAGALGEAELEELDALLSSLPAGHDALDVVMLDGYLCGVLLQPRPVPEAAWLARITDLDARPPPAAFNAARLAALVRRRFAELDRAIARRDWFDPWVYELEEDVSPSETVLPWVAGFAAAVDAFPALMDRHEDEIVEPLATLYRHFDPEDLEDADDLLAEIETLELPVDLAEAVEDLVRSVLLIADVSRPVAARPTARGTRGPRPTTSRSPGRPRR
jgi:uncharacterized protein